VKVRLIGILAAGLCLLVSAMPGVAAVSVEPRDPAPTDRGVASLRASDRRILGDLPPNVRIGIHARTGRVRFLGGSAGRPL